jgi:hypothetical protein
VVRAPALGNGGQLLGRCDQRPLVCPTAALRHSPSGRPRGAPAAAYSCPTTADSRVCRVVGKPHLELLNRLPIHSCCSVVGLHSLESFPDLPLRNVEWLGLDHTAPPVTGWPPAKAEHHSPFGPSPLQRLHPYYGLFWPCAPHRYSRSHGDRPLDLLCSAAIWIGSERQSGWESGIAAMA